MIENFYEVDKDGNITARFRLNTNQEEPRPWWVKGDIENMVEPRYINGEWVDKKDELFKMVSMNKTEEMRNKCFSEITKGFDYEILGKEYHFSYDQENQINFQDTYQLFLNNMITEIVWNAYVDGEKTRVSLDKDTFQRVYLAGVKHKIDTMSRLNDVLIPMINSAESKEVIARIYWDEGLDSESLKLDIGNTMGKKIEKVEKTTKEVQDSSITTMMALLQISALIK